jgi:hypothetical protein
LPNTPAVLLATVLAAIASGCSTGGAPPGKQGTINLIQGNYGDGGPMTFSSVGSARFYATAPQFPGCTTTTTAGCEIVDCDLTAGGGNINFEFGVSAGAISLSGPSLQRPDGGSPTYPYRDAGYGIFGFSQDRIWTGGDTLTVAATGDAVPAFSTTVTAPNDVTLTFPVCDSSTCGSITRTAVLDVSWTGAASSDVHATLRSTKAGVREVTVRCPLASSPATIAAAALAKLGNTADGYVGTFQLNSSNATTFSAGDYTVTFTASAGSARSSGAFTTSN